MSATGNRSEQGPRKEGLLLAAINSQLRHRDRLTREIASVDEDMKETLRALAAIRGVTFISVEHIRQELKK